MKAKRTSKILSRVFIVLCLIVALFPIYWMLCTSLKSDGEIYQKIPTMIPKRFTAEAYSYLLTKTNFLNAIKNSLLVATVVSLLSIAVAYPTAYTLARTKFRGRRVLSKAVLFTYMLPTSVLYIPLYILVARLGLTNTLWGLVLIYPTFTLPYVAWILIPHVQSIPVALEEAAMVDGCSHFMIMYRIIFPLALPGIISTTIFAFAMCWGEYLYALVNLTSATVQTFPLVISSLIYGDMPPWNQLMAGAIMACIPIIIIYMLASSSLVGGATAGGVKQ
mgnify:FL=1